MGVDFYVCDNPQCGETYADCGPCPQCYGCGKSFCSKECAQLQVVNEEDSKLYDDAETTCVLCRHEVVCDEDLVKFLLKRSGLSYDRAVELWRGEQSPRGRNEQ